MTEKRLENLSTLLYFLGLISLSGVFGAMAFFNSMLGVMLFTIGTVVSFGGCAGVCVWLENKYHAR